MVPIYSKFGRRRGTVGQFGLDTMGARRYISLIKNHTGEPHVKKLKPFDLAYEQYRSLKEKLNSTRDPQEKNIIFRRFTNLLAVMEFLVSLNKTS